MTIELWVVLAIGASLAQTTRNVLAQSVASKISPALNSWARFTFCLPFAALACATSIAIDGLPTLPPSFFFFCLCTAVTQLLGNVALVSAFRAGGFGESIVFHKLEVILTAIVGALIFSEMPSSLGATGIVVCGIGVIAANLGRESGGLGWSRAFTLGRAGSLALLCAILLVAASFALKLANGIVSDANPTIGAESISAPIQTLFHTTWIEVLLLTVWITHRERESFGDVRIHWRRMLVIGSAGFIASLGWFWSYSLTLVAYVKAVGQIEALIAIALAIRVLGERELIRQLPGVLLIICGITFVLLG
jgi:drug/metabolite transporter (DMT)-like permease